jgi:hypothetical protein
MDVTEYIDDPRFASAEQIAAHTADAVEILGKAMATRTLEEWSACFATLAGPWAPVQDTAGGRRHPGAGQRLLGAGGRTGAGVQPGAVRRRRPPFRGRAGFAEQTDEILEELDWTGTESSSSRPPARSPTGAPETHAPRHHRWDPPSRHAGTERTSAACIRFAQRALFAHDFGDRRTRVENGRRK